MNISPLQLRTLKTISSRALEHFTPRVPMSVCAWAEKLRRMENGRRFSLDFAPYEREMHETPFRPEVQMTVFQMGSRLGKTETVLNIIGHGITERPRRILIMYPTISQAEKFSKETLTKELTEPTPCLSAAIRDDAGRRRSGNTLLHKMFPGGLVNIFGSNAPGEMRRAKGNLLFADEIDGMKGEETDEGDQLEIFWMRGSEYPDAIKIAASYPSLKGQSKIEPLLLASDYRQWVVPCLKCGHEHVMHRKQVVCPTGQPEKAVFLCPKCAAALTDDDRREMMRIPKAWTPSRPFNGIAGFHGNGMLSPHPPQKGFVSHLHWVKVQEQNAEKAANPDRARRVIVNTFDAETFRPTLDAKPEASKLYARRESYRPQEILPEGVLLLTAGFDVHKSRIEVKVKGYGKNSETWAISHRVLQGSIFRSQVWRDLDEVLLAKWKHPLAGELAISGCCGDSGKYQSTVLAFTRKRHARRVWAIKGSSSLGAPIIPKKMSMVGRPPSPQYQIGTHEAKDLIYQRLELERGEEEVTFPQGYMHFPATEEFDEEYFAQLTAEDSTMERGQDGDFYRFFECAEGVRNEALDCEVYADAAERLINPNYAALAAKWQARADAEKGAAPEKKEPKRRRKMPFATGWMTRY